MAATVSEQETLVTETEFEVPVPKIEADELRAQEPYILPWYRRVPAPGLSGSRHYPGGKRR